MDFRQNRLLATIISFPFKIIGLIVGFFSTHNFRVIFKIISSAYYTGRYSKLFKSVGPNSIILKLESFLNPKQISIGSNTIIEKGALLRCYNASDNRIGKIFIGDNVNIGLNCNISSCNRIEIGNGVLTGRNVMINDNSHGDTKSRMDLQGNPINRSVISKGSVIIGDNVWIGENVVILSGVTVGENSIIGANSVVTKDIPPFSIAGGIPAKIIKQYEK